MAMVTNEIREARMVEPRHPVSDVMLARYVAGDLHGAQLERIERAIKDVPGVAERLARVKGDRDAFLRDHPPEAFAHRIVTRITVEKKPRSLWHVWWALPPVGVAAALLIGVFVNRAVTPETAAIREQVVTDDQQQIAAQADAPPAWNQQAAPAEPEAENVDAKVAANAPADKAKEGSYRVSPLAQSIERREAKTAHSATDRGGSVDSDALRRDESAKEAKPLAKKTPVSSLDAESVGSKGAAVGGVRGG